MTAGATQRQPLDEVMMAMDVVDTLRRRDRLVETEFADADRRSNLKARLREIYEAQGIDVPDRILDEGVAALAENRFVFDPPRNSLGVRLANLYVSRGKWGKWALGGIASVAILLAANYFAVIRPNNLLEERLTSAYSQTVSVPEARSLAEDHLAAGRAALADGRTEDARASLAALESTNALIGMSYTLRIVNRPGEQTGVWRVPDVNQNARNHYIIVEAVDASGNPVAVPVRNEEDGRIETVTTWGLRVTEDLFEAVAADKLDDGIIQNDVFGRKDPGRLEPNYSMPTNGAAITRW